MLQMRYKDFIWPNNPHTCALTTRREVATHKYPGQGYRLENLGMGQRILTGSGEFYGKDAYKTMKKLLKVFEQEGAGQLIHPVIQMNQAIFSRLKLLQEPRENYATYEFEFLEDGVSTTPEFLAQAAARTHTVKAGENLWQIAALYGTTAQSLIGLNPWIRNPNYLTEGWKVKLA